MTCEMRVYKPGEVLRITEIHPQDPAPEHKVGDVVILTGFDDVRPSSGAPGWLIVRKNNTQGTWARVEVITPPAVPIPSEHEVITPPTTPPEHAISQAISEVNAELGRAMRKFPKFASAHEGYAIIAEELDELWDEVKSKQGSEGRATRMRAEAVQVAAMAIRFMLDCKED